VVDAFYVHKAHHRSVVSQPAGAEAAKRGLVGPALGQIDRLRKIRTDASRNTAVAAGYASAVASELGGKVAYI
jgi:hypothetical protein